MGSQSGGLGQTELRRMSGCHQVSSSTDDNNNQSAGYLRSLSSPSDWDCIVTSTTDCRLRIEGTHFAKNTTVTEFVSSTTEESNFENTPLMKELIIDVIH